MTRELAADSTLVVIDIGPPDLQEWLKSRGTSQIVVTGVQTNRCCETTARAAGDQGYDVLFAIDATYTLDEAGLPRTRSRRSPPSIWTGTSVGWCGPGSCSGPGAGRGYVTAIDAGEPVEHVPSPA